MRVAMKDMVILLLLLLPAMALGHSGHSEEGSVAHAVQHGSWLGFAVVASMVLVVTLLGHWGRED